MKNLRLIKVKAVDSEMECCKVTFQCMDKVPNLSVPKQVSLFGPNNINIVKAKLISIDKDILEIMFDNTCEKNLSKESLGDLDMSWSLKVDAFWSYSIFTTMKTALMNFCVDTNLIRFRQMFVEDKTPDNSKPRLADYDLDEKLMDETLNKT